MQKPSSTFRLTLAAILPWILFAASCLPLLVLAYLGTFTRYLADDYSTSGALVRMGFWKAQYFWYQAWSGRFSFTFLISLVELAGVQIVPWLPLTGIVLWSSALYWTLKQLFKTLNIHITKIWMGILATIIIFSTVKSFHEYAQVIFWQTGILTYQISLIFITIIVGVFLKRFLLTDRRNPSVWEYCAWFLIFLIGGGFSETWVIIQISLTGLAFIASVLTQKSHHNPDMLRVLLISFLASWTALLIIAKSPGNMNRDTVMAELSFDLLRYAIVSAFLDLPRFLSTWVISNTTLVFLLFLAGLCAGWHQPHIEKTKNFLWLGLVLLLGTYILFWAGFVPQYAVMGIRPAERAMFMPMFLFQWALVLFGVFLGLQSGSRFSPQVYQYGRALAFACLALTLFLIPVRAAFSFASLIPDLRLYARLWDERDSALRQAAAQGQKNVVAASLRHNPALHNIQSTFWIEADLQDPADHWINQEAANYYGLAAISLRP
jgi:hypothetical protein